MTENRASKRNAERWATNANRRAAALASAVPTKTIYDETLGRLVRQAVTQPKRDGLEWLRNKDHISHDEYQAGLWYADRYRWAHMEGSMPIASILGRENSGSGGGEPIWEDWAAAERIAQARADFRAIEDRIGWDDDMALALKFVCVLGLRLSEASLTYGESEMTIGEFKKTLGHLHHLRQELKTPPKTAA